MSDSLTDLLLAIGIDQSKRNTAKLAEMATWTEGMKQAYWDEQARLAPIRAKQAERASIERGRFALLLVFLLVVILLSGYAGLLR